MRNLLAQLMLLIVPLCSMIVQDMSAALTATPIASNELFGTYQEKNVVLPLEDGTDPVTTDIDYYIATCGNTVMLRAKATGTSTFGGAAWETQLRVETGGRVEIQACTVVDNQNHYTGSGCNQTITTKEENLTIHFFVSGAIAGATQGGYRKTPDFTFNRYSINNPIADNTAPILNTANTSFVDNGDGTISVHFGAVESDDEYFYYVADKEHNVGTISLDNVVTFIKPTTQDGINYTFRAYAVDFNGNMSDYKEYAIQMPFDANINLALNKPATCGYHQNDNVASRANNDNLNDFWTSFGGAADNAWWQVDLGTNYNLTTVDMTWNDATGTYTIYGSADGAAFTPIIADQNAPAPQGTTSNTIVASARYLKIKFSNANVGIKNIIVKGTGVATSDHTAPMVSLSEKDKTINSATIAIAMSDVDDAGNAGTITSVTISDETNGYTEREVLGEIVENAILLSDLNYNTTYNFTVKATDKAGNTTVETIQIVLPFNTDLNIAYQKPAEAGIYQHGGVTADKAVDGDENSFWTSFATGTSDQWWWQVDLGNMYVVNKVRVLFNDIDGVYNILYSTDATEWFIYQSDFTATGDTKDQTFSKVANARYMKFTSTSANVGIKEFEVYATGFAAADNTKPVISTFEVDAVDVTSVTFRIAATDVDDNGTHQTVTYKISGDNDFVTVDVVPDANGLVTVNGLTKHTTYHFTLTATDPSGNYTQSAPLETRVAFDPTVNLALTATATHGCAEGANTADKAIDNDEGTYWGTYGCNDWETSNVLTLDLNQVYTINLVKIISGGTQGAGQIVTLYYSDDAINWLPLKSNIDIPDNTTTDITVVASTQYIQLRATKSNMVAIKEIEVYGSDYEVVDTQAPQITSAILVGEPTDDEATIQVVATDNVGVYACQFVSGTFDVTYELEDGKCVLTGLVPGTTYTFNVYAIDRAGNKSVPYTMTSFKTAENNNVPHTAAPMPVHEAVLVTSIYSNAYSSAVKDGYGWNVFSGAVTAQHLIIAGDDYSLYNCQDGGEIGVGSYTENGDFEGKSGYTDPDASPATTGLYVANREYLHVDIWTPQAFNVTITLNDVSLGQHTLVANNWNAIDIDITSLKTSDVVAEVAAVKNLRWLKLGGVQQQTFAIDNIYFYNKPIVIDENTDPTTLTNGAICDVQFGREMTVANGIWNTIALPFSMTANQIANTFGAGTRVAKLQSTSTVASQNAINLVFAYVNEIEAGTPYIILPTETGNGAIIESVTINTTENPVVIAGQVTMHPVLKTISYNYGNGDPIKFFLSADGDLHYNEASNSIKALRAYFTFDNVTSIAAAAQVRARVVFNENVETGMDNLINENAPLKVIENGQLIIIRDGVKYNIQGQKL